MTDIKWDGTGLPPVGVECEYTSDLHQAGLGLWFKCNILDVGQAGYTIFCPHLQGDGGNGLQFFRHDKLAIRPIKTERDNAIEEALKVWGDDVSKSFSDYQAGKLKELYVALAAELYDAGLLTKPQ